MTISCSYLNQYLHVHQQLFLNKLQTLLIHKYSFKFNIINHFDLLKTEFVWFVCKRTLQLLLLNCFKAKNKSKSSPICVDIYTSLKGKRSNKTKNLKQNLTSMYNSFWSRRIFLHIRVLMTV